MNMKRLLIIMAVLLAGITTITAQSNTEGVPFNVKPAKLDNYLSLRPHQRGKVETLCENFIQLQKEYRGQEQKMEQIIVENLSGMKKVLFKTQFEKYVALLKTTNKNNNVMDEASLINLVKQADEE
jgi:hypothetical protein